MGMIWACSAARTTRCRLAEVVLAIGMAAALAWSPGVSPAADAAPRPAAGGGQLAAWAVTATVPVTGDFVLAVNPATSTVYIGGDTPGSLQVLNGLTGKVTGTIAVPDDASAAAVNPATGALYVIAGQTVAVVSADTGMVTATIPDAGSPHQIAVNPDTNTIYVLNASTVSVIDGRTNTVTATVDISGPLSGIAIDPLTNVIYVSSFVSGGGVSVIDGTTNTVTATVDRGHFPGVVTVNPATDTIYVANAGDGTVAVIDGTTNTVTANVDANAGAGIAADPQTDTIYMLDSFGDLYGLDGRTNEFVVTMPTASSPDEIDAQGLAIDPAAGTIYVFDEFTSVDGSTASLSIITSCRSHVVATAGSNCANVVAGFEPAAATFASPARGVVLGTTSCTGTSCFQAAMMATADGGKHWSFLSPPPDIEIETSQLPGAGLLFTSPDDGWLFGGWHTRDGGATWQHAAPDSSLSVLAMAASPTTVYAAVEPLSGRGELFATPVGAARWTRVSAITADATGLAASGRSVWVTSSARLWATADGRHWHRYPSRCPGAGYRLAGVTATSPSHVAFLCARPVGASQTVRKEILISADGGRTVRLAGSAPAMGIPQEFASPPGDPAVITIAAGGTGSSRTYWLYRSANGGRTWTTLMIHSDPGSSFRSLTYTTRATGWIVLAHPGPNPENALLRTTDGGRTWHKITM